MQFTPQDVDTQLEGGLANDSRQPLNRDAFDSHSAAIDCTKAVERLLNPDRTR